MAHPFTTMDIKATDFDYDQALAECVTFITQDLAQNNCTANSSRTYKTKCTCMQILKSEEKAELVEGVGKYMIA